MTHTGLAAPELRLRANRVCRSFLRGGKPVLELEALLPEVAGALPMNLYYRRFGRDLMHYCAERLLPSLPEDRAPLRLKLEYRIRLLTPTLLSLTLDLQRRDLPNPPAGRFGAVWSRESGFPLPLSRFFPRCLSYRRMLRTWLRNEALERLGSGSCLYDPKQAELAGRSFDFRNYYAAEEGLVLFFPPLTLGSAPEGIPEFCLPWHSLAVGKLLLPHLPGDVGNAILGQEFPAPPGTASHDH